MKKSTKSPSPLVHKTRQWGPLLLSFFIPFLCFVAAMIIQGCVPFGSKKAILYSDEYHQYYPFFLSLRNAIRNRESLMFSWQIGMGIDYLGLAAYYLGSPLNLLSVLVPESLTLHYFAILVPIRLGFAGLFFGIMLKKLYGKNDFTIALFGAFYALCSWALGYMWNVMWLDTFALLPLVVLGAISLLQDKKYILYTLALFFSISISYYIGFFVCIFVLLLFFCYEICRWKGFGRFFGDLLRIALFSALAIGMTAFLELPALVALGSTNSSVNQFPEGFRLNIITGENFVYTKEAWKDFRAAMDYDASFLVKANTLTTAVIYSIPPILAGMREIAGNMGGGLTPTFMDGMPNIYCGTCIILMAFLFLTSKQVKLRDKVCSVVLLVFFMCSFLIRQLDYIWHGFHFPNQIPYRFSFLFSFVMVWMAYRAWLVREHFKIWQLVTAGVLTLGILACNTDLTDPFYLSFNITMVLMTLGLFIFLFIQKKQLQAASEQADKKTLKNMAATHKRHAAWLVAFVMIAELGLNIGCFCYYFNTTSIGDYPRGKEDAAAAISYMKYRERDNLFYRAEMTHTQTYNDSALNNFNGITTFTSSANVHTTSFLEALGYGAKRTYNRYAFEESSPVANLFLNLKYMIEREGDVEANSYFETVHNFGNVYLQENKAYLPLGFLAESTLADWDRRAGVYGFDRQEELFRLATGVDGMLWQMSPNGCLEIKSDDVELTSINAQTGTAHYKTTDEGTVTYGYTITKPGFLCVEIKASDKVDFKVYHKSGGQEQLLYDENVVMPQMFAVSDVKPGDLVWLEIECKEEQTGNLNVQAGILNEEVFWEGYEVLAASTLELTRFSNTRVEGTIDCNRDGLLYTSIPTNGFWYAEVDGEPAEIVLVGECMVGLELTEGEHTVSFRYRNNAFRTGLLVSIACGLVFAGIILADRYLKNRKGKYHQPKETDAVSTEPDATVTDTTENPPETEA